MTMPVFTAGRRLRASEMKAMADQINSLTAPGWTSYTPTLTSSGTAPNLGNGTATGRWRRAANSDLVIVRGKITLGSTSTIGTGTLFCSLPFTPFNYGTPEAIVGSGRIQDANVQYWGVTATVDDPNARVFFTGNSGIVTNTWIAAWATGDNLAWFVEYQPA